MTSTTKEKTAPTESTEEPSQEQAAQAPKSRFILVGALLLICFVCVQLVSRGYEHSIRPIAQPVSELPTVLGKWTGVDQDELDERTAGVLGADQTLGRTYSSTDGEQASVHLAVWSSIDDVVDPAPHHPETCYTGAGYKVEDRFIEDLETPHGAVRVEYLLLDLNGAKVVTAHWFQIGKDVIVNKNEGRKVHQSLWGSSEWPATVKVLMQISKSSLQDGKLVLDDLIKEVFGWTSRLDQPTQDTSALTSAES
ncbi:exosortase C-terminal domain/associated protein EpsI [Thalassoglobus sp. JC818]|uniref:exosortase C-terminal domain/associated protein EpsI n=1 Tax=Thalassoglobus sp. JC818 TaxID=3232136 RepID=UPI00345A8A90